MLTNVGSHSGKCLDISHCLLHSVLSMYCVGFDR